MRAARRAWPLLLAVLVAGTGLGFPAPARGQEVPDRRPVILPPVYPAAPPGFSRLPGVTPPLILREPGVPAERRGPPGPDQSWTPGRIDVVPGIDRGGRITGTLEETPGRFGR